MTVRILPLPEPMTPPAPDRGLGALSTDRGNLPLDTVDVRASITGLAAGVEVTQGFRNPFDVPLEATYIFPLPDRAAVTGLRMEAADRVVDGVLKERGQARQDYDTAIAAGQRAAISEEDRPDVFTLRVGNILPGERVTVRLTLDQPLPYEGQGDEDEARQGGHSTFRFPLVVAPRYIPGAPLDDEPAGSGVAPDTDAVPDASRISPPVLLPGFPNPVRLSVTVDVDAAGLPLTEIRSALHVVAEEADGDRTTIRLSPGERLDRDFILRMGYAPHETAALSLIPDESGEEGTFTLTVLPSGQVRPQPRDVVLLLDRSGSMHGWKMVAARRAAARIVDTLSSGDRFAVLSFDSVIERPAELGSGLADGTDRNRFRAVEHLSALGARGGTEMLTPLEEGCALLADSPHDRVLVLITDGQVGNEDQILARLEPRLRGVRVHTVGIDRAVNAGFLQRLAGAGQGRCELVESEDRLDEAMEQIHHRIGAPLATGLSLHADGLGVVPDSVAPSRLGALFPGVPLVIAGRFRGGAEGGLSVRGSTPDGAAWEQGASGTVTENPAAASIWARAHLRDLEDRYTIGGPDDLEQRIVDTSLRFGVLCRFTAFVAVDSRVVTDGGTPHQVTQPVEVPGGWAAPDAVAAPFMAMEASLGRGASPARMRVGGAPPPAAAPRPAPPPAAPSAPGSAPFAPAQESASAVPDFGSAGPGYGSAAQGYGSAPGDESDALQHDSARGGGADAGGTDAGGTDAETAVVKWPPAVEVRRALAAELRRLEQVPDAPEQRRIHLLLTVLPALEQAVQKLAGSAPQPLPSLLIDLRALHSAGEAADQSHIDELWTRTVQVLAEFTREGRNPSPPSPRRPFWKRAR